MQSQRALQHYPDVESGSAVKGRGCTWREGGEEGGEGCCRIVQVGISGGDVIFGGEVRGKGGEGVNRFDGGGVGKGLGRAAVV